MINIAIIGVGQIGSRHMQALLLHNEYLNIYLVDPNADSLEVCKQRASEIEWGCAHAVPYSDSMEKLPNTIDLTIIATNSAVRLQVLQDITNHSKVKYLILEKFLFPTKKQYETANKLISDHNIAAFVNCPRRMQPAYRKIKHKLANRTIYSVHISGANWNMASNAIHFLDVFAYLTNADNIQLTSDYLERTLLNNKREGYLEFAGTLIGKTKEGTLLTLTSNKEGNLPLIINIEAEGMRIYISEASQTISIHAVESNWERNEEEFSLLYQSKLTNVVLEELLQTGSCGLPTYAQSMQQHLTLLSTFEELLSAINYTGQGVAT